MAFSEADSGFVGHQGAMIESWRSQGKRPVEQELASGGEQEVGTANHFGDLHGGIVRDDGELISGNVIVTPDDKIAEIFSGDELLRTEMAIGESHGQAVRNAEAPGAFFILDLRFLIGTTGARVDQFIVGGVRSVGGGLNVLSGTGAWVNSIGGEQFLKRGAINREALALTIGTEGAVAIGAFRPLEAEPAKVFEHGGDEFRPAPIAVKIFVAENQFAILFTSALLRRPKCTGMAEMKKPGGRGREAAAVVKSARRCW